LELSRWSVIFCAFLFFGFFGFADEARKNYRFAFQSVAKCVGISSVSFGGGLHSSNFTDSDGIKSKGSSGKVRPILPLFVHQDMLQHRVSFDSLSNMSIGDVGGALNEESSSDPEKSDFYPTLSYDPKGNTLSSPTLSSASSITYPTPSSPDGIEISSVHDNSSDMESPNSSRIPPPPPFKVSSSGA